MKHFENGTSAFGASRGKFHPSLAPPKEMADYRLNPNPAIELKLLP
jgi:hypothetical protein